MTKPLLREKQKQKTKNLYLASSWRQYIATPPNPRAPKSILSPDESAQAHTPGVTETHHLMSTAGHSPAWATVGRQGGPAFEGIADD